MRTETRTSRRQWLWFFGMWLAGVLVMVGISSLFRAAFS
jgi:uncharacterized membrane protein YhaH (DUF805 family)